MSIRSMTSPVGTAADRTAARPKDSLDVLSSEADAPVRGLLDLDDNHDETDNPSAGPPRPDQIAAELLLVRTLSGVADASQLTSGPTVTVLEVPDASFVQPIIGAVHRLLPDADRVQDGDRINVRWEGARSARWLLVTFGRDGLGKNDTPNTGNPEFAAALGAGAPVVGVAPLPDRHLPSNLTRAADQWLTVPPLDCTVLAQVIVQVTGEPLPRALPDDLCRSLDLMDLNLVVRRGSTAAACLSRLERLVAAKAADADHAGPSLADLHGYDEAKTWGEALARDLADYRAGRLSWAHVDRGALLAGPPGVGKTFYAKALARTCSVPLVTGSLSEWQAAGHLGDLLRAMRATFAAARQQAPCILFIDEADSFGDRATFDGHNGNYDTQVVNGLLEELDGVRDREGVVVLAACNHPERLDPAIRRSGRLDRTLRVALPSAEALIGILRHHLGKDLAGVDLMPAALAAYGASGADAARWVRTARQAARHAGRGLVMADLLAAIRGDSAPMQPDERRRTAIHEAGHAIAVHMEALGAVDRVSVIGRGEAAGMTLLRLDGGTTRQRLQQRLVALLAGRAAEEVLLGEPSAGAGGGSASDLARATLLGAAMEVSLGFSDAGLVWLTPPEDRALAALLVQDPTLARRVSDRLDAAYREAVNLIGRHRRLVQRLAERLLTDGYVEGEDLAALIWQENRGQPCVPSEEKTCAPPQGRHAGP